MQIAAVNAILLVFSHRPLRKIGCFQLEAGAGSEVLRGKFFSETIRAILENDIAVKKTISRREDKTKMSNWKIQGEYMETCNCDFICPCITSNLTATPTEGDCKVAIAMRIDEGHKDDVSLDGICFIVVMLSPGPMADGNLTVGLIVDESADEAQTAAIADIATGAAGGPMEALAPLVGSIAGVEKRAISFDVDGLKYAVKAGELVDEAVEGLASGLDAGGPVVIDNVFHPVNSRLALGRATKSKFNVFGIKWDDSTGTRNGHFAPFSCGA